MKQLKSHIVSVTSLIILSIYFLVACTTVDSETQQTSTPRPTSTPYVTQHSYTPTPDIQGSQQNTIQQSPILGSSSTQTLFGIPLELFKDIVVPLCSVVIAAIVGPLFLYIYKTKREEKNRLKRIEDYLEKIIKHFNL